MSAPIELLPTSQCRRHAPTGALAALLLASCTNGVMDPGQERVRDTETALTHAPTKSGAEPQKEISIASLPDSTCQLIDDGSGDSMEVLADDEGLVHLWAAATATSKTFTLDCSEASGSSGSTRAQYNFDLAQQETFVPAVPRAVSKRRHVLPGLANPNAMSQSDVIAAGYPPRPDPESPRYKTWLQLVSSPMTVIDAYTVETQLHRGPGTPTDSSNWSGLALDYPGSAPFTTYTDVSGSSYIPTFSQEGTGTSISSMWSGLGGWYDGPIIQEGIDGKATGGVTAYKPWYEYLPNGFVYVSFTMSQGDAVYWEAYECDLNGNYGPSYHGYGCFWWWDITTSLTYSKRVKKPSGVTFTGNTCEVIVERVTDCGNYCWLSSWSGVVWQSFDCYDHGGTTTFNLTTDPYLVYTMKTGSTTLVTPSSSNPDSAGFDYVHSH